MASGFDNTAFSTGLLNGITNYNVNAQKEVNAGEAEQYRSFQEAAHEYDLEKSKLTNQGAKIDALANILSSGKPNPAAYATARDAVEMGYTGQEHLPYVQDAYNRTVKDYTDNPEKWTGVKPSNRPETGIRDSNPANTNILRKYGNQSSIEDIENIRQHKQDRPYGNLQGAEWGNPQDIAMKQAEQKARMEAGVKSSITEDREGRQASALGLNEEAPVSNSMPSSGAAPQAQPQQPQAQQQQGQNPLAISSNDIMPPPVQKQELPQIQGGQRDTSTPPPSPGININEPAPPEQPVAAETSASQQAAPKPDGRNWEYMQSLEKKNPTGAGMVKQLANGEIQISSRMLQDRSDGSHSSWYDLIAAAHKFDPSFDMTDYNARNRMHIDYTSGQTFKSNQAIDTAVGHLGMLKIAGNDLETGDYPALTKVAQKLGIEQGESPVTTYRAIVNRVAPEIVKAYIPTGGSDPERAAAEKDFEARMSSDQRNDAISATGHLLYSRMAAAKNAWETNSMPDKDFYTPNTHAVLKALGVDENDKTPFLTMQQLQQQGQHPLNPNMDKGTPAQNNSSGQPPDFSHLWSQ